MQFVRAVLATASEYSQVEFEEQLAAGGPPGGVAEILAEAQTAALAPTPEAYTQRMLVQRTNEEIEAIQPVADTGAATMHRLLLEHGRERLVRLFLWDVAVAQEIYQVEHREYAQRVDLLTLVEGLSPDEFDVQVSAAGAETFCVQATASTGQIFSISEGNLEAAPGPCP